MVFDSEIINKFYSVYKEKIDHVKNILKQPLTLTEKILYAHLLDQKKIKTYQKEHDYIDLVPDHLAMQDASAQMPLLLFINAHRNHVGLPTTVHCDHFIKACKNDKFDLPESLITHEEIYTFLRKASSKYGIGFWKPGAGIIHQILLEHYAFPGGLLAGIDSHIPNTGGLGMLGIGISGIEAVDLMCSQPLKIKMPRVIGIHLTGQLSGWASPKDVILKLVGMLTVKGGHNSVIEYFGPGAETISATGKATMCNMCAELGAVSSVFPYDEKMAVYLTVTGREEVAIMANNVFDCLQADAEVTDNPANYYDEVIEIDLSGIEPYINGPLTPETATPISEFCEQVLVNGYPRNMEVGLIGSCVNSSYQDLSRAASIARQTLEKDIATVSSLLIIPGSEQIKSTAERDGLLTLLNGIGAKVMSCACGPCIGQWNRDFKDPDKKNSILTSFNRNFAKRVDGNPNTFVFIASPEIVTAVTIAGDLCFNPLKDRLFTHDGEKVKFSEPSGDELPEYGFVSKEENYIAPQHNNEEIEINPESQTLQFIDRAKPWDGNDFTNLALLIKIKGKCTTDQISVCGPWLRYRGHLEKISDNLLMGATNAFNGRMNKVWNRFTNNYESVAETAKQYKANHIYSIIVSGENYGDGSNREHAVLEPRFLNVRVILAKSFAHLHEENLKKLGTLVLTFINEDDYDRIEERDIISVTGLQQMQPGKPLQITLRHETGEEESFDVNHTYTEQQIEWFRAGSALNIRRNE